MIDRGLLEKALAGLPPRMPLRCGTRAPGGPGCGSRSTRPPIPGRTRGAPRAGSTCTTGPATARAPVQDRSRLGIPVHRGDRAPAHRMGRPRGRGAHRARDPDGPDDRAGEERAAPPARRRARREGGAAVRLRRRRQRRRSHRRPPRLAGPHPGPAGGRVACSMPIPSPGTAGTGAPPAAAPRCTAWSRRTSPLPPQAAARGPGKSRCPRTLNPARRSPAGHPALRHRPRRGLAPRASPHPRRPRLVRRQEGPAGPARHPRPRHRRAPARRPRPAPRHVAMARRPRPAVPRRALARLPRPFRHRARAPAPSRAPSASPPRR